ncbi:MAG: hypothetical protein GX224_05630 [Thermoplasmatales archaeon]|nr:hypothetical protein [Thermoplasmatales archaeon]
MNRTVDVTGKTGRPARYLGLALAIGVFLAAFCAFADSGADAEPMPGEYTLRIVDINNHATVYLQEQFDPDGDDFVLPATLPGLGDYRAYTNAKRLGDRYRPGDEVSVYTLESLATDGDAYLYAEAYGGQTEYALRFTTESGGNSSASISRRGTKTSPCPSPRKYT